MCANVSLVRVFCVDLKHSAQYNTGVAYAKCINA